MTLSDLQRQLTILREITPHSWRLSKNGQHRRLVMVVPVEENRFPTQYKEVNISPLLPTGRLFDWIDAYTAALMHQREHIKKEPSVHALLEGELLVVYIRTGDAQVSSGNIRRLDGRFVYDQTNRDIFLTVEQLRKIAELVDTMNKREPLPRS